MLQKKYGNYHHKCLELIDLSPPKLCDFFLSNKLLNWTFYMKVMSNSEIITKWVSGKKHDSSLPAAGHRSLLTLEVSFGLSWTIFSNFSLHTKGTGSRGCSDHLAWPRLTVFQWQSGNQLPSADLLSAQLHHKVLLKPDLLDTALLSNFPSAFHDLSSWCSYLLHLDAPWSFLFTNR